jgi:ubiquinone/menaquinone biosynthesis C-methylase UbiE
MTPEDGALAERVHVTVTAAALDLWRILPSMLPRVEPSPGGSLRTLVRRGLRSVLDRGAWLRERRRIAEERFDTLFAPTYDRDEAPASPTHRRCVAAVIDRCPPGGRILDAACGTGRYFGMILQAGRQVVGVDQSGGMLTEARAKHPEVAVEKVGLQELTFVAEFDAAICVDAMENVFPEDWPTVLANLRRAVRDGGHLYLTVERIDQQKLTAAYDDATAAGLPVLPGETSRGGGYHYYPAPEQVAAWVSGAGLRVVEEATSEGTGYSYLHLLTQASS